MKTKFDDGDYVVFKGNSRPRIISKVAYDKGDWGYVNCTSFNWTHMNFTFGSIRRSSIFEMATEAEVEEYKQLEKLFGDNGSLKHSYIEMESLARSLQGAYHQLECAMKRLKEKEE